MFNSKLKLKTMTPKNQGLTITDLTKDSGVDSVYVNDNKVYDKPLSITPLVELFKGFKN